MPKEMIKARLVSKRSITDALAIFTVETEGKLNYLPGQYAALGIEERGSTIQRDYSIASSPYENDLEFFIERVDDGHLTIRLFELEPGAEVLVKPPQGNFFLDRESGRHHHLMIATVTGIAPFISIARSLAIEESRGTPPAVRMTMLHGAGYADEFGYDAELTRMTMRHPWLAYIPAVSRPLENPEWRGKTGRVEGLIEQTLDSVRWTPANTTAYLCGHPGMIEKGKKILVDRGFHQTQIREEQYWEAK